MKALSLKAVFGILTLIILPNVVRADMSYSAWVHKVIQQGADMKVTVSVFEETEATNPDGEPFPGLDASYSLRRFSEGDERVLFENRVFNPEEAEEVTEYTCQNWAGTNDTSVFACELTDTCIDCDGDKIPECDGFCGVAYRYTVIDTCPPTQELFYFMSTNPPYDVFQKKEGLGYRTAGAQDVGDPCQSDANADEDGACSASRIDYDAEESFLLEVLFRLI